MKLVQLFKLYWPDKGGGIAMVMDMVSNAYRAKYGVDAEEKIIVCRDKPGKEDIHEYYEGREVFRCKSIKTIVSNPMSISFLKTVKKQTKDADFTICHFPYPMSDLAILFGLYKGKLIIWWHADFDTHKENVTNRIMTKVYSMFIKHSLNKADTIIVSAEGNIDGSPTLRPYKEKCVIIPFAVNEKLLLEGLEYKRENRQKDNKQIRILFIGRFVWYKGIDILLKAFAKLDSEKYELTLVGDGVLFNEMVALANSLMLKNVNFLGAISEEKKYEAIKGCDYLVLPSISKSEAFAIVQIEAMAFGKPVINTYLPSGVPDVSLNGITGITVNPFDIEGLSTAMRKLGENEHLRKTYGDNAIRRVQEKFSVKKMYENYNEIFNKLEK